MQVQYLLLEMILSECSQIRLPGRKLVQLLFMMGMMMKLGRL